MMSDVHVNCMLVKAVGVNECRQNDDGGSGGGDGDSLSQHGGEVSQYCSIGGVQHKGKFVH